MLDLDPNRRTSTATTVSDGGAAPGDVAGSVHGGGFFTLGLDLVGAYISGDDDRDSMQRMINIFLFLFWGGVVFLFLRIMFIIIY